MTAQHPRSWEPDAACAGHDDEPDVVELLVGLAEFVEPFDVPAPGSLSELFFPPRVKEIYPVYAARAKDYCLGTDRRHPCPVRKECLIWAIHTDEEHGIWGGMSHRERNALVRKAEAEGENYQDYIEDTLR